MEVYASAALTGMGYMLNQERDSLKSSHISHVDHNELPSMNNMYESDYWRSVKRDEKSRGDNLWKSAESPLNTGVVPKPAYASMFASPPASQKQAYVKSLTGDAIPVEQFQHNNMQPYFRGSVKQNLNADLHSTRLEAFTGRGDLLMQKKEVESMFAPTAGFTNICGMANNSDYYLAHTNKPIVRNNDFPIEQVRVGPGLDQGYTATPSGGFQQSATIDYARPKNVDQLRVASKPRFVNEGNMGGPVKAPEQRGIIGEVAKNRPETYFSQTKDQWLKTTGANLKETNRTVKLVKPNSRTDTHVSYEGNAQAYVSQQGKDIKDNYGKAGDLTYDN